MIASQNSAPIALKRLLIVGAYGVVGEQIVKLMSSENSDVELWLAGRSLEKATALAARYEGARSLRVDMNDSDPLAAFGALPDAVLAVANDAQDNLLLACVKRGVAYIDITRWTDRMLTTVHKLEGENLSAPVLMSSAWMAGVVATVVAQVAQKPARIDRIEFDVLFALKDKAGPNSIEYVDRLRIPFTVQIDGASVKKFPFTDPRQVKFSDGRIFETMRFDTPDQHTLPKILGIPTVAGRVGYDDAKTMGFMKFMLKSGLWSILSMPSFDKVRRSLLFNPGEGAPHEIQLQITGQTAQSAKFIDNIAIMDPLGQTHLTAAGAVMQVERMLNLHGLLRPANGVSYPESAVDAKRALDRLLHMGVQIKPC